MFLCDHRSALESAQRRATALLRSVGVGVGEEQESMY